MSDFTKSGYPTKIVGNASAYLQDLALNQTNVPLHAPILPITINCARHSEDLAWIYYTVGSTATKTGVTKKIIDDGKIITLSELTSSNAFAFCSINWTGASLTPYVIGKKYLISLYVYSAVDFWWTNRDVNGGVYAQGMIRCKGGYVTRVQYWGTATSTTLIDTGATPTLAPGAGPGIGTNLLNSGGNSDIFVGGLQIEALPASYVDGIALIGDSTMAGASGSKDLAYDFAGDPTKMEVSTILASELKANVFNRALGGDSLASMDARWATDITPLKPRCQAVIIQGGINDIASRTLAQMQASVQSMTAKATADGFTKIYYLTCTPYNLTETTPAYNTQRIAFNDWLKATYGASVSDIASVVTDPSTNNSLYSACYGDGTHYTFAGKSAIAAKIINDFDFSWIIRPSEYVKVQS